MANTDDPEAMEALYDWSARAGAEVDVPGGLDADAVDAVLRLATVAARDIVRPAAPVSSYLAGYLLGSGAAGDVEEATDRIAALIRAVVSGEHGPPPAADFMVDGPDAPGA